MRTDGHRANSTTCSHQLVSDNAAQVLVSGPKNIKRRHTAMSESGPYETQHGRGRVTSMAPPPQVASIQPQARPSNRLPARHSSCNLPRRSQADAWLVRKRERVTTSLQAMQVSLDQFPQFQVKRCSRSIESSSDETIATSNTQVPVLLVSRAPFQRSESEKIEPRWSASTSSR
jgi:hypothetical protein